MIRNLLVTILLATFGQVAFAQSTLRFDELPGHGRYQAMTEARRNLGGGGRVEEIRWSADGKSLVYTFQANRYQLDLTSKQPQKIEKGQEPPLATAKPRSNGRRGGRAVERAMQRATEASPDGKWKAVYRDFNVWLEPEGKESAAIQVTQNGHERKRFGTCCWVYGEELDQNEAMWWSPDSKKLVYYEVDETDMKDYYLTLENTASYTTVQAVRYPKAGDANPRVGLWIYDLASKESKRLEFDGEATQYLYGISFAPLGDMLLVHRTNRRQDLLDLLAVDVKTGKVSVVVQEKQATWQANSPKMQFLEDGKRFIWETEANGWKHFQLRSLDGSLLNPLSQVAEYPCQAIQAVDESAGWFYYTASSAENPYNVQLHRAKLDGSDARRITTSPLNHTSFDISPDHRFVVATREQFDVAPSTAVYDMQGSEIAVLAKGDRVAADELHLAPPELFSFQSTDGSTTLYGTLHKPSNFDPNKKYPLLIDVYGGPSSAGLNNRYDAVNPICELGFLVAKIGNRGTVARGKAFESATYMKLGGPDLDDQAEGVRFLAKRPYVDGGRVGIFGHSYGGYMSALAVLKYPDVFHVAVSGAPVTDWKNYDTIYTERYMRTPQENGDGYANGACMKYAGQLQGKLLLVHGLIDDNVHPSNTWQLGKALHAANRRFDMMIYPEFQHGVGSTYSQLRWEYFYRHLIADR